MAKQEIKSFAKPPPLVMLTMEARGCCHWEVKLRPARFLKQPQQATQRGEHGLMTLPERCKAVNVLLQEKADWDTAKKVLNRPTFLQDLKGFDKDSVCSPQFACCSVFLQ